MSIFSNQSFGVLEKTLNGLDLRNKAISNNLANVDTPNYKRQSVSFRNQLRSAMEETNDLTKTNDKHITIGIDNLNELQPEVSKNKSTSFRNDGNNVNIDKEMSKLAKNSLEYRAIVKQVSNQFNRLGSVIQKGGN